MKTIFPLLVVWLVFQTLAAQELSDAERLAKLGYMKYAPHVNCDSTMGSNLEHRICLNLEFQAVDSVLNTKFQAFLQTVESDSLKVELTEFQKAWVNHRRLQSSLHAEGLRGHMVGISYLAVMVNVTRRRIEELDYFLETR